LFEGSSSGIKSIAEIQLDVRICDEPAIMLLSCKQAIVSHTLAGVVGGLPDSHESREAALSVEVLVNVLTLQSFLVATRLPAPCNAVSDGVTPQAPENKGNNNEDSVALAGVATAEVHLFGIC